jgi:hypothetical protein
MNASIDAGSCMKEILVLLQVALGGVLGVLLAFCWDWRAVASWRQRRRAQATRKDKGSVAGELHAGVPSGYHVYHDVPIGSTDRIDHAIVGPAGVFVIETKSHAKPEIRDGRRPKVSFDGDQLVFDDRWVDVRAPQHARAAARWLTRALRDATGKPVTVSAVIAVPDWWVLNNDFPGIIARNPRAFTKELIDAEPVLEAGEIADIIRHVEQMVPIVTNA